MFNNKKLYEKIINKVSQSVIKTLNERDFDEDGVWEYDEEYDDNGECPHNVWEGIFDLNTNEVYSMDNDPEPLDPEMDKWFGRHKYVYIEAKPYEYNSYTVPSSWNSPAEGETEIYSYEISCDPFMYTTNEYDGLYYFEGEESSKEPFDELTEEQEEIISDWLDKNVSIDFWDFY